MSKQESEHWHFEFQAEASNVPESVRYRKLLKYAKRVLALRCVRVSGETTENASTQKQLSK